MKAAGAVAISDDGLPVMNARVMRRAMEFARSYDLPIIQHCEDLNLSAGGDMHEGVPSVRLGLRGIPAASEDVMVARDIVLAETTGVRFHVAHISSRNSIAIRCWWSESTTTGVRPRSRRTWRRTGRHPGSWSGAATPSCGTALPAG